MHSCIVFVPKSCSPYFMPGSIFGHFFYIASCAEEITFIAVLKSRFLAWGIFICPVSYKAQTIYRGLVRRGSPSLDEINLFEKRIQLRRLADFHEDLKLFIVRVFAKGLSNQMHFLLIEIHRFFCVFSDLYWHFFKYVCVVHGHLLYLYVYIC